TTIVKTFQVALDQQIKKIWSLNMDSVANVDWAEAGKAALFTVQGRTRADYLSPAILQDKLWDKSNGDSTNRTRTESLIFTKIEEIMMKRREEQRLPKRNLREEAHAKLVQYKGEVMDFPAECSQLSKTSVYLSLIHLSLRTLPRQFSVIERVSASNTTGWIRDVHRNFLIAHAGQSLGVFYSNQNHLLDIEAVHHEELARLAEMDRLQAEQPEGDNEEDIEFEMEEEDEEKEEEEEEVDDVVE
ncbi:hypothetical protein BGZ47_003699, partial [Haplosporangium gracile]